jgi:Ca2+:H+ antiporter
MTVDPQEPRLVEAKMPMTAWAPPLLGLAFVGVLKLLGLDGGFDGSALGVGVIVVLVPILFGAVFAAVYHAELIAHRTGEPFGTLVLAMSVTVMEVALLASALLGADANPALARDTIFAVVMIVGNGLVGVCILLGGLRHKEQSFRVTGASAYLAVLISMSTLSLVMPNFTVAAPGGAYSANQLAFAGLATLSIYLAFLYTQTVRNREYFAVVIHDDDAADKAYKPSNRATLISFVFLVAALMVVILLSKTFTSAVEVGLNAVAAPAAVAGVIVAFLILLPEFSAAVRATRANKLQKSVNLALGSACATIGLTIPAIALLSIGYGAPLELGLSSKDTVLLLVTFAVALLTFGTGRTNILYGLIHLVLFATFCFLTILP